MAEETKTTPAAAEVVVPDTPAATETPAVVEKVADTPAAADEVETVKEKSTAEESSDAAAAEIVKEEKITQSASFKEETNIAAKLPDQEKKALAEFKQLVLDALTKHEFTTPPPPPPPAPKEEEEKKPEPEATTTPAAVVEETKPEEKKEETKAPAEVEEKKEPEVVVETPPPPPETPAAVAETSELTAKVVAVEKEVIVGNEEVKETIVEVTNIPPPPPTTTEEEGTAPPPHVPETVVVVEETLLPPEEISIWGIPLLADERSDTILLKFLRARDFKIKDAFTMLKSVVAWRKEFGIETLLEEESVVSGLEKVVFIHGVDKEGHSVCYNVYGEFQDKDLYQNAFADAEKQSKFLRWRIQFLEKSIRKLDFNPDDGISTFVQVNDLKNSPGLYLFKKELRQATNQALQLLQDNYPEFVAKQVFINVPWWYVAYNRIISPFLTARTKSKFVFAGPSKTAETLFKYIAPEQVPVQYGGLSKEGEQEFSSTDAATDEIIKPASKHSIEFPVEESSTLVWEFRVLGWEVSYGAEFVPSAEGGYTVIVQKTRKIGPTDEPVVTGSYKASEAGKVVLKFENQTSKKKKLLYRSKIKNSE